MAKDIHTSEYKQLVSRISSTYILGQQKAVSAVNTHLVETYWKIGEHIVEYEQEGNVKAEYGKRLLENLARDLSLLHGKGFSRSNIQRMKQFYITYPICAKPSHKLSWSHYVELLKIDDPLERSFYEKQTLIESWSIPELVRQKKASLFLRLAASKDKKGILELAQKGQVIKNPVDIIREPYVLDFLHIPEAHSYSETELEESIISKLQDFLLELGKGFAFIGRQYRLMLGNRPHRIDLVFYHYILKCFVLIDLKREEASYEDIGQMNMYLGYFEKEVNQKGDKPPIGIVLAREKDEFVIEYATHNISSRLFVSKYQLYLPTKEELIKVIEKAGKEK
jgi:predicted nuclease of restriction endonuclease-like (RecB) superfamily